ncbi:MAG: hypothetical protein KUL78_03250 [Flavobacterium sp.]|nr:hypothetical protein [Flavobacterium sp.]
MEEKLTKKEVRLQDFMEGMRLTVLGWKNIMELNKELGLPTAVMEMATIEVRTGFVSKPFIKVDRFVDGKLVYRPDIVISGVPEGLLKQMPYGGIKVEKVRHPKYDGTKMPKATQDEINEKLTISDR